MPVILQPQSCCDICMDDYSCGDRGHSPYAIDCGHIFCMTCIRGFTPKVCPFCRKSFSMERKLHVDAVETAKCVPSAADAYSSLLLGRVAVVFDEASTAEDTSAVIADLNDWISACSDRDDTISYKSLRLALDALYHYRSYLRSVRDVAILRVVKDKLQTQLLEEREAAKMLHDKLQCDWNITRDALQVERNRILMELRVEREASQDLRNILHEAADNIQTLRIENMHLLSELQMAPKKGTSLMPTGTQPRCTFSNSDESPSNLKADVESPSTPFGKSDSSVLERIIRELQDRSRMTLAYEPHLDEQPHTQRSVPDLKTLSFSQDGPTAASLCVPKGPLFKMASTPAFRENENKYILRSAAVLNQAQSFINTPHATTGTKEALSKTVKDHKLTPRWPFSMSFPKGCISDPN